MSIEPVSISCLNIQIGFVVSIINFWLVSTMQDGNVTPFTKSEPIPEVNDDPVKVVVADSLHDVVFKSRKNGVYSLINVCHSPY